MNTILVPLDGSAIARQSLPYVQMLAILLSARIHLLRVLSAADRDHMLSSDSLLSWGMRVSRPRHIHSESGRCSRSMR